jgi:hypothetical protein
VSLILAVVGRVLSRGLRVWGPHSLGVLVIAAVAVGAVATIGVRGVDRRANMWRLARALGFAGATAAFQPLGFIPAVGGIIGLAVSLWALVANVMAIRQPLNVTTGREPLVWLGAKIVEALAVVSLVIGIGFIRGSQPRRRGCGPATAPSPRRLASAALSVTWTAPN